jgi:hypothetical protein
MRRLPPGRIGTSRFLVLAGLSKQTFYRRYRHDPRWIKLLDMRVTDDGILSFDEASARELGQGCLGQPATRRSPRADRLQITGDDAG